MSRALAQAQEPLSPPISGLMVGPRLAARIETVDTREAGMDFLGLARCGTALPEGFERPHLRIDPASSVIARTTLPDVSVWATCHARDLVARAGYGAILFPEPACGSVSPDASAREDRGEEVSHIIAATAGQRPDLPIRRKLAEEAY